MSRPSISIALRGHVRQSLLTSTLRGLVQRIALNFDTTLFVHTWDVVQNSLSWRNLDDIPDPVTEDQIKRYFSGFDIAGVKVDSDRGIRHPGSVEGKIGLTDCPILAWKNMYRGKLEVCRMVAESREPESVALQMRFDVMSNPFSPEGPEILDFVSREHKRLSSDPGEERIGFLREGCFLGLDNIYMARTSDMLGFVSYMYYDMDRILKVHEGSYYQEHIAFHERMSFLGFEPPSEPV